MVGQNIGNDHIIRQLVACQEQIKQVEKLGKQREKELREAMKVFENLFELSPDAVVVVNRQGHITRLNKEAEKLFGYTRKELIGGDHGKLVPERFRQRHESQLKEYMSNPRMRVMGIGLELAGLRKNGTEFAADIDLGPIEIGKEFFVLSAVRDASKRKNLEDELVESERRFRTTFDNMLEACVILDFHWRYRYVNDAAVKLGQRTKEERLGRTLMEVYPGIEKQDTFAHLRRCMKDRVPDNYGTEFTFPEGNKTWFDVRVEPVPEGMLILYMDITQRKKLEEELNRYRQRLEQTVAERTAEFVMANEQLTLEMEEHRKAETGLSLRATILDNAREAIFLINPKGGFVYANQAACQTYGYSREEFLTMNLQQLLWHQEPPAIPARLRQVLQDGQMELETVHVRKDGSLMPVRVRHNLVKTPHGRFIVSVMRDIVGESRLRSLLEEVPNILWSTDTELLVTLSMGNGLNVIGLEPGQGVGTKLSIFLKENGFGQTVLSASRRALAGASVRFTTSNKKAGISYVGWSAPLRDVQANVVGSVSALLDSAPLEVMIAKTKVKKASKDK